MKALVYQGPSLMAVEDVPDAVPGPGEVVVEPEATGICGSEVEGYLGLMPNRVPPLVMGHEIAGPVIAVGEGIDESWIGKRVAINPIVGCGECRYCLNGDRQLCPDRYLVGVGIPGGFATSVAVPERCLFEMPEAMDARLGALVEPLANGVHALRQVRHETIESAVVIGAGTIGIACMHAALARGIDRVVVAETNADRRAQALALGAHEVAESAEAVSGPVDLVLDAVGTGGTRSAAIDLLGPAGTALFVGMHADESELAWRRVVRGNLTIRGTFAYSDDDYRVALDWLANGRGGIGELREPLPLEDGPAMFAELARGATADIKVFLRGSAV